MVNTIAIRIDIRSSVHMMIFAIVAVVTTFFLLTKTNEAIEELERLNEIRGSVSRDALPPAEQ